MASGTLNVERRSGPTRRCGMTVLGKVAVPKPINLPSQRSENNGLDPGIEIVPKGTISWGSRPSASVPNVWGTSARFPNTDGGTGSPSLSNSRPSSGGSGRTSQSTDKTHDLISNARDQCSRPSSAHGTLTSNQMSSASLRPRSAETKPCSPLSKSSDLLRENYRVWSGPSITERMISSANSDGFSMTTGEFPTLGSEKNNSSKGTEIQGPSSRPRSSAGSSHMKESNGAPDKNVKVNDSIVSANEKETGLYHDPSGIHPSIEKSRADNGPFTCSGLSVPHFEQWRGPPLQGGGLWLRGPPGGPPFVTSAPLGAFPPDQFPYYRAQVPPPIFPQPQPGAGVRAPLPQCGDQHLPHVPDPYARPGAPVRPGYYPGPFPYDGFYGPIMGYCNPNECDTPFIGAVAAPRQCNTTPCQGPLESGNSRPLHTGHGTPRRGTVPCTPELFHGTDSHGPSKIMLRQHNGSGKVEQIRGENHMGKKSATWEESSPRSKKGHSTDKHNQGLSIEVEAPGTTSSSLSAKKSGGSAVSSYLPHKIHADPKGTISAEGIDSLNMRSLSPDAKSHISSVIPGDDRHNKLGTHDLKASITNDDPIHQQRKFKDVSSTSARQSDDDAQEQMNILEIDARPKKSPAVDSMNMDLSDSHETCSSDVISIDKLHNEGEEQLALRLVSDENQRERMKELARQRAKQLQEEEEVRSREQKAKAQAKLEELERRVKARSLMPKSETNPPYHSSPPDQVSPPPESILGPTPKISHIGTGWDDHHMEFSRDNIPHGEAVGLSPGRLGHTGDSVDSRLKLGAFSKQRQPFSSGKNPGRNSVSSETADPAADGSSAAEAGDGGPTTPSNTSVVTDISTNQRRKGNNRGKNKGKTEDTPSSLSSQKAPKEAEGLDISDLNGTQGIVRSTEIPPTFSGDKPQSRGNSQWRPTHHRKLPRNPPAVTKLGGGESVMWAPVKPQEKTESVPDKPREADCSESDALNLDSSGCSKLRRAEMERYVPKVAAKEPCPQEIGTERPSTLTFGTHVHHHSVPFKNEEPGAPPKQKKLEESGDKFVDPELKTGDNRPNKQVKPQQRSWRQRPIGLSSKKSKDLDGCNSEVVKGRQQPAEVETTPILPPPPPQNSTANPKMVNTAKESRGNGERSIPQWQPKSQASAASALQNNRGKGGKKAAPDRHVVKGRPKEVASSRDSGKDRRGGGGDAKAEDDWGLKEGDERQRQSSRYEYQPVRGGRGVRQSREVYNQWQG